MEKFIPIEKLSKAKRRELNSRMRRGWGDISPVTRKPKNPKAYDRKKFRKQGEDSTADGAFVLAVFFINLFSNAKEPLTARVF